MTEEIAGVDNAGAGVNNSGGYFIGGHCKSGQGQRKSHGWTMKEDISLVDIARVDKDKGNRTGGQQGGYFVGGHCKSGQGQRKSHGWTTRRIFRWWTLHCSYNMTT